MKIIFIILFIICSYQVDAQETNAQKQQFKQFNQMTKDIIGYLYVEKWIDYVKRIKSEQQFPKFYLLNKFNKIDNPSLYKRFDIIGYEKGLTQQVYKNISFSELEDIHKQLSSPFPAKMLHLLFHSKRHSYVFSLQDELVIKDLLIDAKRAPLIESIYNLMSYKTQTDHILNSLRQNKAQASMVQKILQKDNLTATTSSTTQDVTLEPDTPMTLENIKKIILFQINQTLLRVSINELRQFINILKNKNLQKFVALYNAYDYFYIFKFYQLTKHL